MSSHPRNRHVFDMPATADSLPSSAMPLPESWSKGVVVPSGASHAIGFVEQNGTVSISATHFQSKKNTPEGHWQVWPDLGLSNGSISIENPGNEAAAQWVRSGRIARESMLDTPSLDYAFTTTTAGSPKCFIYLLPTFPVDSSQGLRYGLSIDGKAPIMLDAAGAEEHRPGLTDWSSNVLRNAMVQSVPLGDLPIGKHTLRLIYGDPGVVFEHITVVFSGAAPAYPFAPETTVTSSSRDAKKSFP